jgi:hypothetical protein
MSLMIDLVKIYLQVHWKCKHLFHEIGSLISEVETFWVMIKNAGLWDLETKDVGDLMKDLEDMKVRGQQVS